MVGDLYGTSRGSLGLSGPVGRSRGVFSGSGPGPVTTGPSGNRGPYSWDLGELSDL